MRRTVMQGLASLGILLLLATAAWSDALCNGNALAGPRLRPLTVGAAAATLRAASEGYQMLALLEEGEEQRELARRYGEVAASQLDIAIKILDKQASGLPDDEFKRMTTKLQGLNMDAVALKLRVSPSAPFWQQLTAAARGGGRGWLKACIDSKVTLRNETRRFTGLLVEPVKPAEIWQFMTIWGTELSRQRFLSTVLYE